MDEFERIFQSMLDGHSTIDVTWDFAWGVTGCESKPEDDRYYIGKQQCRICEFQAVYVWPLSVVEETNQECGNCGHMASEPMSSNIVTVNFDA